MKWPAGIKSGTESGQTVGLIDIMATLSELTGQQIKEPDAEDSYSFYHLIREYSDEPARDQIIYLSSGGKLAVKAGKWKYIECLGSGGFTEPKSLKPVAGGPGGQLYNMEEDPFERNNLYLEEPEIVNNLSDLLQSIVQNSEQ